MLDSTVQSFASGLSEYEAAKFELADIVRTVAGPAIGASRDIAKEARELLARLAEDRFNLVVAGRFGRGKTTLLNAVLGTDRLPTGVPPLTSVITSVEYGSRERVQIDLEGGPIGLDIGPEELPDYVTERGNPGNARSIRAARVTLPAEILRRGFHFIDTPGLGSGVVANTGAPSALLPQADAIILVCGYDGPLADDELQVARDAEAAAKPLFVVLNKCDIAAPETRVDVEDLVRRRLMAILCDRAARIFPLSALVGLAARRDGDRSRFVASGVAALESELTRVLIEEKNRALLLGVTRRVERLIERARSSARSLLPTGRLEALIEALSSRPGKEPQGTGDALPRMDPCVICEQAGKAFFDFLRRYQYELVKCTTNRERLAAAGGLCAAHLRLYASIAKDRDICVVLAPLVSQMSDAISSTPPGFSCIACARLGEAETAAIEALRQRYGGSQCAQSDELPSVCVPHLRLMVGRGGEEPLVRKLIDRQSRAARRLAEDMQRYAVKRDGLRAGLVTEEEAQAARRALAFLAGIRVLNAIGR